MTKRRQPIAYARIAFQASDATKDRFIRLADAQTLEREGIIGISPDTRCYVPIGNANLRGYLMPVGFHPLQPDYEHRPH